MAPRSRRARWRECPLPGVCGMFSGIVPFAVRDSAQGVDYSLVKYLHIVYVNQSSSCAVTLACDRVLENVGFELEGTLRSHHFRDGKPDDVLFFGMMRPA